MKAILLLSIAISYASVVSANPDYPSGTTRGQPSGTWPTRWEMVAWVRCPSPVFPKEMILINEETIWEGGPPKVMPESFAHLEKIKELEAAGDCQAADRYFE